MVVNSLSCSHLDTDFRFLGDKIEKKFSGILRFFFFSFLIFVAIYLFLKFFFNFFFWHFACLNLNIFEIKHVLFFFDGENASIVVDYSSGQIEP